MEIDTPMNQAESSWIQTMNATLLSQGAEARIYECIFLGKQTIVKERFAKQYRHPVLDERINTRRLHSEARMLNRARKAGVDAPCVFFIDEQSKLLYMEKIDGITAKQYIWDHAKTGLQPTEEEELATKIGHAIADLHNAGLVHGDLTTSNMIIRANTNSLVMIDYGLSFASKLAEDKAVDLYVLERAFLSTHTNSETLFAAILTRYGERAQHGGEILGRLNTVRLRGRKKVAFG
jgi:TP53 regulating kinase-like protein